MFSCKTRGFCPSCHAKRREEWGDLSACGHAQAEWMREKLILDRPHRQVVFTIPKMLRIFFKYNRSLLSSLCLCGKVFIFWLQREGQIKKVYEIDPLICPKCGGTMPACA